MTKTPTAARLLATDSNSKPMAIRMRKVDSSHLAKVGYRASTRELFVDFHDNKHYRFRGVPQDVFDDLMKAESVGEYFAQNIKDEFRFSRRRNRTHAN
jgi:transposase